jgi:hypothetical protein
MLTQPNGTNKTSTHPAMSLRTQKDAEQISPFFSGSSHRGCPCLRLPLLAFALLRFIQKTFAVLLSFLSFCHDGSTNQANSLAI